MRRDDLGIQVQVKVASRVAKIKNLALQGLDARDPGALHEFETKMLDECRQIAGEVVGLVIESIFEDERWQAERVSTVRIGRKDLRVSGNRPYKIHLLSGNAVEVSTPYLAPRSEGRCRCRTRIRKARKLRRRHGSGMFPAVVALGVSHHCSPALMSDLACQVVQSASDEEARQSLARRGVELDVKTVWNFANLFAIDSMKARDDLLRLAAGDEGEFQGKRIVMALDGGRIRMRHGNKRGRIPKGKKRRGFKTPWQEPKVFTAYVIDSAGKRVRSILPIIDGTMGDADALIALVVGYLRLLGARSAEKLVIIGDGARWIWDRVGKIIEGVGIDPKKVTAIVDFYHAVEHLQKFAEYKSGWREQFRKQWVTKNRKLLRKGKVVEVIGTMKGLVDGRNSKKLWTEIRYFIKNAPRMKYAWFKKCGLPIGSGAVESCIRRVVNLRMKSPTTYWKDENAEGFLHLRSVFKSGRWDEVFMQTLETQAQRVAA
jgi:hypothetical protein